MNIKAIIFDFDGTLVDSEKLHFDNWNRTLSEFKIRLDEEDYVQNYAGIPTPINSKSLIEKYSLKIKPHELTKKREQIGITSSKEAIPKLMPFADKTIKYFYEKRMKLGIVTGSPLIDVKTFFSHTNYAKYFDFIITRDDVKNSKPNSESYIKAVNEASCKKSEIIVFEDTFNGIESAKNAGLICFGIQKDKNLHHKLSRADKIFMNLNQAKEFIELNYTLNQ